LGKGIIVELAASPFNWPIPRIYGGVSDEKYSFLSSLDGKGVVTTNKNGKVIFEESKKIGNFEARLIERKTGDLDPGKLYFAGCICNQMGYEIYEEGTEKYNKVLNLIKGAKK